MDISKLLGVSEAPPHPSRLKELVEEAGQREEDWKRNEYAVEGELYECPTGDLHKRIVTEFTADYVGNLPAGSLMESLV